MKIKIFITFLCFGQTMLAQNTQVIVIFADQNDQKKVFNIDESTKTLILTKKPIAATDTFFDAFIIRPSTENPNAKYIISAKENHLFLYRDGNELKVKDIREETGANGRVHYAWDIQYMGYPYITISDPQNIRRVIYIEGDVPAMKVVPNAQWNLADNNDTKGSAYRYKINKITSTF